MNDIAHELQILPIREVDPELKKYRPVLLGKVLILEGLISAGKSKAGRSIEKYCDDLGFQCKFFPEPVIPDLLQLFLNDQKKYAFAFQLAILIKRQSIYKTAYEYAKKGYFCIIDRSLYGDYCFAKLQYNLMNLTGMKR